MPKTHFQPAPAGLTPDQLRDYQERERHANNAVAIASSAGTAPSPESLALMQRHVDGELSIEQVIELTDAMLKARYAPRPPGLEDLGAMLQSPGFQERFEDVVSGTARRNNSYIVYVDAQKRTVREYPATEEIFETNADGKTLTLLSIGGVPADTGQPVVVEATPYRFAPTALLPHNTSGE
ncbi:antitoxin VbhA family protein [Hymenobacter coccineus]|uniref:Antitoxin VbhA domain-containing protein n=1 Tax=Hymenobacter coccineus TaxID=1908235 RepID=A0A1G1TGM8_9BACT|nr:antitoxin VbhA family protein [Hymenobacter coccineus]OGX90018.1 hypothetical protein BEN49_07750 [Hymenobacter coccineus]